MSEDFYDDDYAEAPPAPLFWRILGKIIKYSFTALIIFINAFLLWRVIFSTNEPGAIKTIAGNTALAEAWEQYSGDSFARYQAEQDNIATDEEWHDQFELAEGEVKKNEFAQFFLTDVVFFPYANQTQVVLRYNKSLLPHLAEDFGLDTVPGKKDDIFDITLVVYYKNDEDVAKKMRIGANLAEMDTTSLYTFRQYYFESLPEFSSITKMQVEIYYKGDVDYTAKPYSVIEIYDKLLEMQNYPLDSKDIAAIEGAK